MNPGLLPQHASKACQGDLVAENRKHPRTQITSPIAFQIGDGPLIEAESRDISLGGMFITTTEAAAYGATIKVYINLPDMKHEAVIDSIVRWNTAEGMGVQFGRMGARETHGLTLLLAGATANEQ